MVDRPAVPWNTFGLTNRLQSRANRASSSTGTSISFVGEQEHPDNRRRNDRGEIILLDCLQIFVDSSNASELPMRLEMFYEARRRRWIDRAAEGVLGRGDTFNDFF